MTRFFFHLKWKSVTPIYTHTFKCTEIQFQHLTRSLFHFGYISKRFWSFLFFVSNNNNDNNNEKRKLFNFKSLPLEKKEDFKIAQNTWMWKLKILKRQWNSLNSFINFFLSLFTINSVQWSYKHRHTEWKIIQFLFFFC